jgi:fucose 4-O-acetylase-like acetyltransferase
MIETVRSILLPYLKSIAAWFSILNLPEPIIHWGHPLMMGIVIFVLGSFTAWVGWQGRISSDAETSTKNRKSHRKLAPWLFLFISLGYTGGVLSLVMQEQSIFESPHFWTGSLVVFLLALNGFISATKFGGNKDTLKTTHAYLGSFALLLMFVHAFLGLNLGLSI